MQTQVDSHKKIVKKYVITYIFLFLFASFPLIFGIVAEVGSFLADCPYLDEGSAPPCPLGNLWYAMSVFTWSIIFTLPVSLIIFTIVFIAHMVYLTKNPSK